MNDSTIFCPFTFDYADLLHNSITLMLHQINAIAFWTFIFSEANTNVLFLITSILYTRALFIKFRQTLTIISTLTIPHCILLPSRWWSERKLLKEFRRHYTLTLGYFFAGNRHFGRLFLVLLSAHCPVNVFLVVVLIHSGQAIPAPNRFFITAFVLYQFTTIFGVHLMFASAIRVIYRPRRILCRIVAENGVARRAVLNRVTGMSEKGLINLSLLVHSFPADKQRQVGFTYGPLGQVTVGAFARYVLLYGKFLLITYK